MSSANRVAEGELQRTFIYRSLAKCLLISGAARIDVAVVGEQRTTEFVAVGRRSGGVDVVPADRIGQRRVGVLSEPRAQQQTQ